MLYTRKGDDGTTKTFACDQRISKSSAIAEALGALDEANSYLGLCKVRAKEAGFIAPGNLEVHKLVHNIQRNLFIVQAEVAGSEMSIDEEKVKELESVTDAIEKELPPIKTFFISGGTELAVLFDIARTLSRRAERRVVGVAESTIYTEDSVGKNGKIAVNKSTLAYLNRLSSVLYAFARLANHRLGFTEESPDYK